MSQRLRNVLTDIGEVLKWIAALIAVGSFLWALFSLVPLVPVTHAGRGALAVHAITILFLVGSPAFLPRFQEKPEFDDKEQPRVRNAINASRQFVHLWYFVWVGFFALYFTWTYFWPEISKGEERLTVHL